ncbi:MAG: hypothetical protein SF182_20775 [Deltaproteobacteria bacterium]|nr:hypothetical protein [Deltaproteobacteria bacterium]
MALLPPSTNARYRGAPWAASLLTVVAILTVVPGAIHTFLPDGGAGVIAGIDLGPCGPVIIALFAWAGATQIALGLAMLAVSLRYRDLVPLFLALVLLERTLHALDGWWLKGSASGHHPPEHFAVLVAVPLLAVALRAALRGAGDPYPELRA